MAASTTKKPRRDLGGPAGLSNTKEGTPMSTSTIMSHEATACDNGAQDVPEQAGAEARELPTFPPAYGWAQDVDPAEDCRVQSRTATTSVAITHTDHDETSLPTAVTLSAVDTVDEDGTVRRLDPQVSIVVEPDAAPCRYEPLNMSVEQARSLRDALDEVITASTADKLFALPLPSCAAFCGDIHSEHDYDHVGGTWHHDLVVGRVGTAGNDMTDNRDAGFEVGVTRDDDIGDRAYIAIEDGDCAELSLENVEQFRDAFAAAAALLKGGVQGGMHR